MHTPGPWEVREGGSEVFGPAIYAAGAHELDPLAAVDDIKPNADADARLIAAAPELLEALEILLREVENDFEHHSQYAPDQARAAIAKARGESESAPNPERAEGASR